MDKSLKKEYSELTLDQKKREIKLLKKELKKISDIYKYTKECLDYLINK